MLIKIINVEWFLLDVVFYYVCYFIIGVIIIVYLRNDFLIFILKFLIIDIVVFRFFVDFLLYMICDKL